MYTCIYVYMHICKVYMYIYIYVYMIYVCIYVYVYVMGDGIVGHGTHHTKQLGLYMLLIMISCSILRAASSQLMPTGKGTFHLCGVLDAKWLELFDTKFSHTSIYSP